MITNACVEDDEQQATMTTLPSWLRYVVAAVAMAGDGSPVASVNLPLKALRAPPW